MGRAIFFKGCSPTAVKGSARKCQQSGTLTANTTSPTLYVYKNPTLATFTSSGAVIRIEDTTASSGPLLLLVKQGTTYFTDDQYGHIQVGGTTPSLTSCGTGSSVSGTDTYGTITTAGTLSSCTLNFANTYTSTLALIHVSVPATGAGVAISSSSATAFTFAAAAGTTYSYLVLK
jgi:hypothetical protein